MEVELDDLVDQSKIAARFHTSRSAVNNWTVRHSDFPLPVARFGNVPVYLLTDVTQWYIRCFGRKKYERATGLRIA